MFKCECGAIFDETKNYIEDTKEAFTICPNCNETNFNEVKQCRYCDECMEEDEMHDDICCTCLEEIYTDELGCKYIDKHKDFYLNHYGVEKIDDDLRDNLIEILEKDFKNNIDKNHRLKYLKEYILDDLYDWIEFLKEEGEV